MAIIIMSRPASKLEPSLKKKAYAFLEKLVDVLGIDESLADRALGAVDEDALMALAGAPSNGRAWRHSTWRQA
jgi:hypothetical protein